MTAELNNRQPHQESSQLYTSFPNENKKHIDYVIAYKIKDKDGIETDASKEKEPHRKSFLKQLKKETLELYTLDLKKDDEEYVYILLHCPIERLMIETEKMRLEMRLKNVN